jgi:hypothetical protein
LRCLHHPGKEYNYGKTTEDVGDGETGGNVACYFYDPDYNNVEFCGAMDTIENYRARSGDTKGSARAAASTPSQWRQWFFPPEPASGLGRGRRPRGGSARRQ